MAIFKKVKPEFERLPLKKMFVSTLIISVATLFIGFISQIVLPPQIPLFFGLPQTNAQLAPSIFITMPSIIVIIMTLINILVSMKIHDLYLKKALAFASISASILATITTIKIIFLVSSL